MIPSGITSHLPRSVSLLKGVTLPTAKPSSDFSLRFYRTSNIATATSRPSPAAPAPTPAMSTTPSEDTLKASIIESRTRFLQSRAVFMGTTEASALPLPRPTGLLRSTSGNTALPPALSPKATRIVTSVPARTDHATPRHNVEQSWPLTKTERASFALPQHQQASAATGIYHAAPVQLGANGERLGETPLRLEDLRRFPTLYHWTAKLGSHN
ncbi:MULTISPECIES: hypothetical protein [unclassified Undibacterium]|uniref:hypothetical protein n=1 Tax=unclassified Undibacterium TaxID=2630295 RepID=UPI002AC8EB43|nr:MULTISPECIES: hypothetical protein [unclassified Undibacterium]MEB0139295.1 hypothetical protein [Undibacterium sp. CCC2.1]MEB0172139.1 hypothetical protein [Undibacterium sp. CCC1.1]MEB0176070.1 hypothetical protein [Undibacterium sp. CCC3.4]MEB0215382.1 hypothetical protein [Undibacterium sp. 5I2]WPX43455.1 hypothetical protein RHM61_19120 [Undibacterium sp. CCC3.4]